MSLIARFNPHDMREDLVLRLNTGRDREMALILDAVKGNLEAGAARSHLMIVAPRGYGKSFLMRLTQIRLRQPEYQGKLGVALLPEEQMNINAPDLLLREILRVFLDAPPDTVLPRWDRTGLWEEARTALDAALDERFGPGRGLLVAIVENLDMLLAKAFPEREAQATLRQWLNDPTNRVMLLAGSAAGDLDNSPSRPLFKQFTDLQVTGWSEADCVAYLKLLVKERRSELTAEAEAKAKAIATFIGGNPRLAVVLGDVLLTDDALTTAETLDKLVDELTPYYQDRIATLGGRAQSLLDALLRGGEPCSQSELAERVGAKQSDIARAFTELLAGRIVIGEKALDGKETLYRVEDRVFAHYYRKRHLLHGTAYSPFEAITEFLKLYFTPEEKRRQALKLADGGHLAEARLLHRMATEERPDAWRVARNRVARVVVDRAQSVMGQIEPDLARRLETCLTQLCDGQPVEARHQLSRCTTGGAYTPIGGALLLLLNAVTEFVSGQDAEAEDLAGRAEALFLHWAEAAGVRAATLLKLWAAKFGISTKSFLPEAAALVESALEADDAVIALRARYLEAEILIDQGRSEEALRSARAMSDLADRVGDRREQAAALGLAAFCLGKLWRLKEALVTAQQAAALADGAGDLLEQAVALRHVAFSLAQLGQSEEAVATALRAASLAERAGNPREMARALYYATFGLGDLRRYEESVALARQAGFLADLVGDFQLKATVTCAAAFNLWKLGRNEEALALASEAAVLAERVGDLLEHAVSLFTSALAMKAAGNVAGALSMAKSAAFLASKVPNGLIARQACSTWWEAAWILSDDKSVLDAAEYWIDLPPMGPGKHYLDFLTQVIDLDCALFRLRAWEENIPLALRARSKTGSTTSMPSGNQLAGTAAAILRDKGRAEAFATISAFLAALGPVLRAGGEDAETFQPLMFVFIDRLVSHIEDPGLLTDVADRVVEVLPESFAGQAALLRAAAVFHASGRDAAALQRVDPDIALALRRVFPPEQAAPPAKPRRKPARKGSGGRGKSA